MASRPIAEQLAKKQKEISVSEFFERNKHILGFDSSVRALITSVKEAVDNALDACEEASILPELHVEIQRLDGDEVLLIVEDNGPGIVKRQMGNIFGRLLYGSRFHAIRQSRGQQGIGISAAVMYGQLTTGKPAIIDSKIGDGQPVVRVHLKLDTRNNKPDILKEDVLFGEWADKPSGTRIQIAMSGRYQRGAQSVFEYLRSTAIVNPHAQVTFKEPDGTVTVFERATDKLPEPTVEIKPHPEGIELGTLLKMARLTEATKVGSFLHTEFVRMSPKTAREVCGVAGDKLGMSKMDFYGMDPKKLDAPEAKALMQAFKQVRLQPPPTDCLSPVGELLVKKGLKKELPDAEFIATVTRKPAVYSGRPFQVEVGIAYGGSIPKDDQVRIIRFANRVPLLYQKGACVSTQTIESVDWRRYELEQRGGKGIPVGPAVMLVHVASTNVPFTSEAKEAMADIEEIANEVKLALQECGRKLGSHVRKKAKFAKMREKEQIIRKIIPRLAEKSAAILGKPVPDYEPVIARIMNNMMITDRITYDAGKKRHTVEIDVANYCDWRKTFELVSVVPHGVPVAVEPEAESVADGIIRWKVKRIPLAKHATFTFHLDGLDETDFDETELYVSGLDEARLLGAEPWKAKDEEEIIERIRTVQVGGEAAEDEDEDAHEEEILDDEDDLDGKTVTLRVNDDRPKDKPKKARKAKGGDA